MLALIAVGCEKMIAEDITGEMPALILPNANDTIGQNPVHFKWEEMKGATKYHLEVVSPGFASIQSYALDSIVTGTDFFYSLDSNEYELRLTASNGAYDSQVLGPVKFWVGVQSTGGPAAVVLNTPLNASYVNASFNKIFSWSSYTNATSYEFSLRSGTSFSTGTIITTQNAISTTSFTDPSTLAEGEYHWAVKAYTATGETSFSIYQLFIDTTLPNVPALGSPTNGAFLPQGAISFTWNNGMDTGIIQAPVSSTLEISTDPGFATIVHTSTLSGGTDDVTLTPGTYYWRAINNDAAGNSSGASPVNQLTVN